MNKDTGPDLWKDVPGFNGRYQAHPAGKVRSVRRTVKRGTVRRLLKPAMNLHGYTFHGFGAVHRIIAMTFIGPIPKGMHVNHINGIRHDNRLSNLEILTPRENVDDSFRRRWGGLKQTVGTTSLLKAIRERNGVELSIKTPKAAARMCGIKDGSTFVRVALRLGLHPHLMGRTKLYLETDVARVAAAISGANPKYRQPPRPAKS